MIYDVNSQLFRSFLAVSGSYHKAPPTYNKKAPGEGKKDNKPAMVE